VEGREGDTRIDIVSVGRARRLWQAETRERSRVRRRRRRRRKLGAVPPQRERVGS
jgi:hypothetical protein